MLQLRESAREFAIMESFSENGKISSKGGEGVALLRQASK